MKYFSFAVILTALMLSASSCNRVVTVTRDELPEAAQTFLQTHFAGKPIFIAEKEGFKKYGLLLADGTEIEFDRKGQWKEVDCENAAVPASFVASLPDGIKTYIDGAFSGVSVVQVSREGKTIDVELNNGVELEFSEKGEFIKADK